MPYPQLDRSKVKMRPLAERPNKKFIERDRVESDREPRPLPGRGGEVVALAAERIRAAGSP